MLLHIESHRTLPDKTVIASTSTALPYSASCSKNAIIVEREHIVAALLMRLGSRP